MRRRSTVKSLRKLIGNMVQRKKIFLAKNLFLAEKYISCGKKNIFLAEKYISCGEKYFLAIFSARNIFFRKKYFFPPKNIFLRKKYIFPQEIYFFFRKKYIFPQEINFSPQEIFFSARNISVVIGQAGYTTICSVRRKRPKQVDGSNSVRA